MKSRIFALAISFVSMNTSAAPIVSAYAVFSDNPANGCKAYKMDLKKVVSDANPEATLCQKVAPGDESSALYDCSAPDCPLNITNRTSLADDYWCPDGEVRSDDDPILVFKTQKECKDYVSSKE